MEKLFYVAFIAVDKETGATISGTIQTVARTDVNAINDVSEFLSVWLDGTDEYLNTNGERVSPIFESALCCFELDDEGGDRCRTLDKLLLSDDVDTYLKNYMVLS